MLDIALEFATDLSVGATGDLGIAQGDELVAQRFARRLLTNPGDYLWHLEFGGGLARMVGGPLDTAAVVSLVRGQIAKESGILQNPPADISLIESNFNRFFLMIAYSSANGGGSIQQTVAVSK